jgi:D-alanyl-D-alanine dipeptidase
VPGHRLLVLLLVAICAVCAGCTQSPAAGPSTPSPTTSAGSSLASIPPRSSPVPSSPAPSRSSPPRSAPAVPPLSTRARAAGLIDIRTIVPDAIVDLRYATSHNFVGVRLYPTDARCVVHRSMAPGLRIAAQRLRRAGYLLVFWDCYRPHAVQVHMFRIVPDANWVARPGPYATSHEAARSVDVTLARAPTTAHCPAARRVHRHCLLQMGTGFDDFTPRAWAYATDGVSRRAQANRALLRQAMAAGGISVYSGEWWHFDGPGALVDRPHLHAPLH